MSSRRAVAAGPAGGALLSLRVIVEEGYPWMLMQLIVPPAARP
jgi:hypothetical protein